MRQYDLQDDPDPDNHEQDIDLDQNLPQMIQKAQLPDGPKRKYGNMLVLHDGNILITLGPDYWCFLPTFVLFFVVAVLMIWYVLSSSSNMYLCGSAVVVCGGMCLSYLAVATSNPGIVTQSQVPIPSVTSQSSATETQLSIESRKKLIKQCRRCNIWVKRSTYHCSQCDVCITQYDHHCPWTSKCIGGGNLKRFYLFLAMIPIFFFYSFVVFGVVATTLAAESLVNGGVRKI